MDARLEALLLQCLAKATGDRPASASALSERLAAVRADSGVDAAAVRRWWEGVRAPPEGLAPSHAAPSPHGTTVLNIDLLAR